MFFFRSEHSCSISTNNPTSTHWNPHSHERCPVGSRVERIKRTSRSGYGPGTRGFRDRVGSGTGDVSLKPFRTGRDRSRTKRGYPVGNRKGQERS